ncbi:MAG: ubiquinol-cytochrome c reductase iron-sulfur subunit [Gammaproteobacteria bacterium]|nr:ubiquinol-cytochrome c reductase iron-sulfur subunit [Gammaproteobacteria bacterium]
MACDPDSTVANPGCSPQRRALLKSLGLVASGLLPRMGAGAPTDPTKLAPQLGDELWFPSWEATSRPIVADEVLFNGAPLTAVPYDPIAKVLRESSRLNQILVVRIAPTTDTKSGVLAYSGICTHAACAVSEWNSESRQLLCPCHGSAFDPAARGAVTGGPARRALPTLPVTITNGKLVVAGSFSAAVGAKKSWTTKS